MERQTGSPSHAAAPAIGASGVHDRIAPVRIGRQWVGPGHRPMVIAEAGVNHNGQAARAHDLVDAAANAGADAVKFQAFEARWLVTPDAPRAKYQADNTGSSASQYEMLKALELSAADFASLRQHCDDRGIMFLCTPFDQPSADMLARLDVPAMKIPSGEVTNTVFLRHLAKLGLPLILSTGMATLEEIRQAVATLRQGTLEATGQAASLAVLHCVSSYPASPAQMNLRVMHSLRDELEAVTGLSDHTLGTAISFAATAMGACIIEKHFTLDRNLPGPDHRASLEPAELAQLVQGVKDVHVAMGDGIKAVGEDERATAGIVRRSIAALKPIRKGQTITLEMLTTLRPAGGIAPAEVDDLLGKAAARDLAAGQVLHWKDLQIEA